MKRIWNYLEGFRGIILIVYLWLVLSADIFISGLSDGVKTTLYILTFAALTGVCPPLIRLLSRFEIRRSELLDNRNRRILCFAVLALICIGVLLIYYIGFYPGAFSVDSIDQYKEVISGKYSDWHPVMQTLFTFWLPLTLTGGWVGSIVLFQCFVLGGAIAYGAYTVLRHSNLTFAVLYLVYVLVNPVTEFMAMYPWKDVAFAAFAMIGAAFAVNVWFTRGEWLRQRRHLIATIAVLVFATLMRHNAILFTLPILIAVLLYIGRKKAIICAVCFVLAIFLVKVPLYSAMQVEKPKGRAAETLGLAMTMMGEVLTKNPAAMTDEEREFMYRVVPEENWAGYTTGSFNSVKYSPGAESFFIDDEGFFKVLGYTVRTSLASPKEALTAFVTLTDMVYTVTGANTWVNIYPSITNNEFGIALSGNQDIREAVNYILNCTNGLLDRFYWFIGVGNLAIIACLLAKLRRRRYALRQLLIVSSVLIYNFGTMLLLTGQDFRFFFYSFLVTPLMLLVLLGRERPAPAPADVSDGEPSKALPEEEPPHAAQEQDQTA